MDPSAGNKTCYMEITCNNLWEDDYENEIHEKLDAPMPWIGLYITAASVICTLAMAADALRGFRRRRLWFPCKYFSINAFSLTILAVAMKLPLDLTSMTTKGIDKLDRISSLVLMSTSMCNFMTSLGSMSNNEIILNLAALAILVITISGNVCIHMNQLRMFSRTHKLLAEEIISTSFMLFLLLLLCFSAVMVPTAKRYTDLAYQEMHKRVSNNLVEWGEFNVGELGIVVRRYWVMAQTGSSQFVIARSVTCVASGLTCLLMSLTLFQAGIRMLLQFGNFGPTSNYKWSINWIILAQTSGVVLGTIAPVMRWFVSAQFKSSKIGHRSFKDEFKVETYWTQRLVDWRERPVPLQMGHHISRKLLHGAKGLLLNICIHIQIVTVLVSKLVLLVSASFLKGILFCFYPIKNLKVCYLEESNHRTGVESRPGAESDYSPYVLLLEGEAELPQKTVKNICSEVDKLIQIGREKKIENIIKLLKKSVNFNGVREFDISEVPSLHSHPEPPKCWSLPVVTLTSIAISLPNISGHKPNQLLSSVSEGLYYVKLMEKSLDRNEDLAMIRHAAEVVWVQVELFRRWHDKDLQTAGLKDRSYKETLQKLSNVAEKIVTDFTTNMKGPLRQNPLNWPVKVIAAHSMYRITQTILLANKDDECLTDEELFERLSIMISDILAACLTNLACVITLKCYSNAIEEREESVRQAAILLGESEEILEMLKQRDLPSLDPKKAGDIEEWRAFMESNPSSSSVSATSINDTANPHSHAEQVSIEILEG